MGASVRGRCVFAARWPVDDLKELLGVRISSGASLFAFQERVHSYRWNRLGTAAFFDVID